MQIERFYQDVSNGGFDIEVHQSDDGYRNISIKVGVHYYDYPSIVSNIDFWSWCGPNELEEMGLMLIRAANKIRNQSNV